MDGLNVDGYDDGEAVILYYMPAMFAEGQRVTKNAPEEKRIEGLMSYVLHG